MLQLVAFQFSLYNYCVVFSLSRGLPCLGQFHSSTVSSLSMPAFQKVCPKCASVLHVRKSRCPCGHCFSTKPKLALKPENVMKSSESRKNSMAECQARKRGLESSDQSHRRRLTDSKCHALKRARETSAEFQSRKQADSEYHAHKKARATPEESQICKQTNAKCNTQKRAQETSEKTRRCEQADVKCHAQKKSSGDT